MAEQLKNALVNIKKALFLFFGHFKDQKGGERERDYF